MMHLSRPLQPADVLIGDPTAQLVQLPNDRVLARHGAGITLLHGLTVDDLRRVLDLADGTRTVEQICEALAEEYDPEAVRRLIANLAGDLLRLDQSADAAHAPRVFVAADRATAERLSAGLVLTPDLAGAQLAVAALAETSYRDLLDLQAQWLAAGVPSLFVTADPDGVRIGPLTIPGASPCFACAQLAALGSLRLSPEDTLATAAGFRTGRLEGTALDRAAAEIQAALDPQGAPDLLNSLLRLPPLPLRGGGGQGVGVRVPVERRADCPLCGVLPDRDEAPAIRRAERLRIETEERRTPRVGPPETDGLVTSIGILGGGTAGYLTALALRRKVPGLAVTLIESPDVPIIGVGEATTPLMPQFLHVDLGLDVHRLFREVKPTFKLGIRFLWGLPETGDFHYPFGPVRFLEPVVHGGDPKDVSLQSMLMAAGAVPLYPEEGPEDGRWTCRLGTEVAYHLDNERFVAYLQRRAAEAGIERIEATVADVERSTDSEEIRALRATDGRRLSFDLFVDCTGFRSLLLEQSLGSPWISFDGSLWTDRAVVGPVPHGGVVRPYTTAETLSSGWCWSTPQEDCDHRGYVFASAFQTPDEAEAEMRRVVGPGMGAARLVRFRAGRHAHFWKGNVVALGNAYGFVEPLESTALHMLIRQIGLLVRAFPLRRGERGLPEELSRKVGAWWDYLRWFLALHYKFNRRVDSPFWRACRQDVDVAQHAGLLAAFRERGPLTYDPAARAAFDYPDPLWGPEGIDAILLGQGVEGYRPRPLLDRAAWTEKTHRTRAVVARAERHERALELLVGYPELLDEMVAAFRAAGPAFP
ncbi:MAG TPA: tryptophan 7-halogenase [Thermoanaerobaculia bacterium]|nr:tryptophan 7-halogenase [Thermoanaerobaculia bacterium]